MGSSSNESNSLIVNMKYLALLAIALFAVVAAEPEADADAAAAYYGGYYGHPGYYGGYGLGHRYGYGGYYGGYAGYGRYGYAHHYGKRSADAEPEADAEADPAYLYAGHYGYAGYPYGAYGYPYGAYYGYRPAVAASHQHVSTAAATYGIHQLHKRDADAEPEADAAAAYYGGYYGHPGYYGYAHHYGKRSAAEAEPAVSYSHRSPQGARGFYGFPYARYAPFAYHGGLPYYG